MSIPYFRDDAVTLYTGDALEAPAGVPDTSVPCAITGSPLSGSAVTPDPRGGSTVIRASGTYIGIDLNRGFHDGGLRRLGLLPRRLRGIA